MSSTKPPTPQKVESTPLQDPTREQAKDVDTVMKDSAPVQAAEASRQPVPATMTQPMKEPEKVAEPLTKASVPSDAMDVDSEPKKPEISTLATATTAPTEKLDSEIKEPIVTSGGPATGTRSAQSPLISNKPLSAPTSVKRMSRRSSMARKLSGDSGDGRIGSVQAQPSAAATITAEPAMIDGTNGQAAEGKKEKLKDATEAPAAKEDNMADADDDGDSITVTSKKQRDDKVELKETEKVELRTPPPRRAASGRITRKRTGF